MRFHLKLSRKRIAEIGIIFLLLLSFLLVIGLQFLATRNIATATKELSSTAPSYDSLNQWVTKVSPSLSYLGLPIDSAFPIQAFGAYSEFAPKFNSTNLFKLPELKVINEGVVNSDVDFETVVEIDGNFPEGISYMFKPGERGMRKTYTFQLQFSDSVSSFESVQEEKPSQPKVVRTGSANHDQVKEKVAEVFAQLNLPASVFQDFSTSNETSQTDSLVRIGQVSAKKHRCPNALNTSLSYDFETQKYIIQDSASLNLVCATGARIQLTCTDCNLAPVDKVYTLPNNYIPSVVPTGLPGEKELTPAAKTALTNLFKDANNKGVYPFIVSGYRSYQAQVATFEYWIQQEMAKGYSRSQAEVIANTYSALPGQSEHQLGTAVDLSCNNCDPFTNVADNQIIYDYLKTNAHRFGFVISYPANKDVLTGYKYEPWHIRYIGVDLATDIYNQGYQNTPGTYLGLYLFMLNRY